MSDDPHDARRVGSGQQNRADLGGAERHRQLRPNRVPSTAPVAPSTPQGISTGDDRRGERSGPRSHPPSRPRARRGTRCRRSRRRRHPRERARGRASPGWNVRTRTPRLVRRPVRRGRLPRLPRDPAGDAGCAPPSARADARPPAHRPPLLPFRRRRRLADRTHRPSARMPLARRPGRRVPSGSLCRDAPRPVCRDRAGRRFSVVRHGFHRSICDRDGDRAHPLQWVELISTRGDAERVSLRLRSRRGGRRVRRTDASGDADVLPPAPPVAAERLDVASRAAKRPRSDSAGRAFASA